MKLQMDSQGGFDSVNYVSLRPLISELDINLKHRVGSRCFFIDSRPNPDIDNNPANGSSQIHKIHIV